MEPLVAISRELDGGGIELLAPAPGFYRRPPAPGTSLAAGGPLGELEILGRARPLVSPSAGVVAEVAEATLARRPVGYGDRLLVLRTGAAALAAAAGAEGPEGAAVVAAAVELALRAPSSGRFYCRPAPDKPPFVAAGDEIAAGQTVCLLEVMKTFNRIAYGGEGLPPRARVVAVVPADGDDLASGDVILSLEPLADV